MLIDYLNSTLVYMWIGLNIIPNMKGTAEITEEKKSIQKHTFCVNISKINGLSNARSTLHIKNSRTLALFIISGDILVIWRIYQYSLHAIGIWIV